jgi:hypothetical protein
MTVSENFYITESPWLISKQLGWEVHIANADLPYWARVHAVVMARSEPNLHTPLEPLPAFPPSHLRRAHQKSTTQRSKW